MGIYLPNMEMPKEGNWITLRIFPDGECSLYSWCGNDFDFMEHLTAVPVPEPHGRLIDADAIPYKKIIYDGDDFYCGVTQPYIDRMPTIIPAS